MIKVEKLLNKKEEMKLFKQIISITLMKEELVNLTIDGIKQMFKLNSFKTMDKWDQDKLLILILLIGSRLNIKTCNNNYHKYNKAHIILVKTFLQDHINQQLIIPQLQME
jgi:hypothetical protein